MSAGLAQQYVNATRHAGLYYILPIANIASVMEKGILSNKRAQRFQHLSVAMQEVQERREQVKVPNGFALHEYVNLYFDPRNPMMYRRKDQVENLCVLRIRFEIMELDNVVVSDRNASRGDVLFCSPMQGLTKLDFPTIFLPNWTNANPYVEHDQKGKKCAEVLVPDAVPIDYIDAVFVASESGKRMIENLGCRLPVKCYPSIFFR